jgi:Ran GTPase-activating protein (RanGAP) involved in mRNA processing and transport
MVLKKNSRLHTLRLKHNMITNEGAESIASAIRNNKNASIEDLDLEGCPMSAQALETVNAAVRIRIESRKEELERMVADAEEMENDVREGESRAYDLGLLPVLEKGGLRTPKNIKAAVDFLDAEGAESLADIVKYNLLDDFFNAIGVDPGRRALVGKLKDAIRETAYGFDHSEL